MDLKIIWIEVLKDISSQVPRTHIITYFKNSIISKCENGICTVSVSRPYFLKWHVENTPNIILQSLNRKNKELGISKVIFNVDASLDDNSTKTFDILKIFPSKNKDRKIANKKELKFSKGEE